MTAAGAFGFIVSLAAIATPTLAADALAAVKSVRVETLGSKPGAADVLKELDRELRKTAGLRLAPDDAQADAVLRGDCEIWVRGYVSLNPRAGTGPGRGTPIYGGFLSVELRDRHNAVLWSYLATPHPGTSDVEKDLSRQIAKSLKLALEKAARKDQP